MEQYQPYYSSAERSFYPFQSQVFANCSQHKWSIHEVHRMLWFYRCSHKSEFKNEHQTYLIFLIIQST